MTTILPSPFCSVGAPHDAPPAETLPAVVSGTEHPAAGSVEIQSSCGGVENSATADNAKRQERVAGLEARSATIERRGSATGPQETDLPEDLKQRYLAAIEADYRIYVVDLEKLEADLYAPPDIRGESFEDHIAKLDELIDDQPLPIFLQRTG